MFVHTKAGFVWWNPIFYFFFRFTTISDINISRVERSESLPICLRVFGSIDDDDLWTKSLPSSSKPFNISWMCYCYCSGFCSLENLLRKCFRYFEFCNGKWQFASFESLLVSINENYVQLSCRDSEQLVFWYHNMFFFGWFAFSCGWLLPSIIPSIILFIDPLSFVQLFRNLIQFTHLIPLNHNEYWKYLRFPNGPHSTFLVCFHAIGQICHRSMK